METPLKNAHDDAKPPVQCLQTCRRLQASTSVSNSNSYQYPSGKSLFWKTLKADQIFLKLYPWSPDRTKITYLFLFCRNKRRRDFSSVGVQRPTTLKMKAGFGWRRQVQGACKRHLQPAWISPSNAVFKDKRWSTPRGAVWSYRQKNTRHWRSLT